MPLPFCLMVVDTFMQFYCSTFEEALCHSLGVTLTTLGAFTSSGHAMRAGAVSCQELPASLTMRGKPFWQRPCLRKAPDEVRMEVEHTPQRSCSTP